MKKQITIAASVLFIAGAVLMTGCSKSDTTPPVITVKGGTSIYSSLNAVYTDAGATASDDKDGDVTSKIVASGTVNKDMAGNYLITYSVSDAAGNKGTATRNVTVRNDAYAWEGSYAVHDSCGPTTIYNYNQTITASTTVNNRLGFDKFADYSGNTGIYGNVTAGTTIDIPSQTATSIGSLSETHTFSGTGTKTSTGFTLTYTDQNVTTPATTTCHAKFTKQ